MYLMAVNHSIAAGLDLLAAAGIDWTAYLDGASAILMTVLGLSFIIFVHELGHFAAAKWCGVQCDKFMIGFDIGGYKLSHKWGETEYGIGILPLGGYVKMMGQDDDPRMSAEQIRESQATDSSTATKEIVGPGGEKITVDARSYLAKTVPQRMLIISAGVIMNVIFAFVFAFIAFGMGVPSMPCIVGATDPGLPAWQAGWETGDEIVQIGELKHPWFDHLRSEIPLTGQDQAVTFQVLRAESGQTESFQIQPSRRNIIPAIGVSNILTLDLPKRKLAGAFSPAGEIADQLPSKSHLVAIDGEPVDSFRQLTEMLAAKRSQPLTLTFERKGEQTDVTVAPNPSEYIGLVLPLGPIVAVQQGSPAAQAGLKAGDRLLAINGTPIGMTANGELGWDPRRLDGQLAAMGEKGETVTLEVERGSVDISDGATTPAAKVEQVEVTLRPVRTINHPFSPRSLIELAALGVACPLRNEIQGVVPGSPASEAGIQPGDVLVSANLVVPKEHQAEHGGWVDSLEFAADRPAWPYLLNNIQDVPPGSQLELQLQRAGSQEPVELKVAIASDDQLFSPWRGFDWLPQQAKRRGETLAAQASLAWDETQRALTSVYRFLNRIVNADIPVTALGGPVSIAKATYYSAQDGIGQLLLFLTLISANLAVVNFLPIPLLDGGHMVFLIYEGIMRKPANENFVYAMHLAGFALIITLMLFVFGLDFGFIDRGL